MGPNTVSGGFALRDGLGAGCTSVESPTQSVVVIPKVTIPHQTDMISPTAFMLLVIPPLDENGLPFPCNTRVGGLIRRLDILYKLGSVENSCLSDAVL